MAKGMTKLMEWRVIQTIRISNASNSDWEDITYDGHYLYIGDFGNNVSGNRTNLRIYKIDFKNVTPTTDNINAEILHFSYENQTDFTRQNANETDFDCEAMVYYNNKIHLFTKQWISNQTAHYTLPDFPGTHVAQLENIYNK